MDLLKDFRRNKSLSYIFITHDLTAITYFCDKVRFMHNGRFVEAVDDMNRISQIQNPYARDLLHVVAGIGVEHVDEDLERASELDVEELAPHGASAHAQAKVSF